MSTPSELEAFHLAVFGDRLGLPCHVESPGFLTVPAARPCFVLLDPADPGLLRLGTTEPVPDHTPDRWVAGAVERVNRRCSGVKATRSDGHAVVVLAAEMVVGPADRLPDPDHVATVGRRMLDALVGAVEMFTDDLVLRALADDPASRF